MAYVPQQIPKEEENKFGNPNQTTPNPIPPQGGSAGAAPAGGRAAPGVGTSTQFGSNAAKLSDYLTANKDQVGQFGQQVAGDLSNRYDQTMGAINQGYGDFSQQVQGSYTPPDQSKVQQALQKPEDFVKDSTNLQQWQDWYNPQYKGPQSFEGSSVYSNINDTVNKAVQDANLTQSQSGLGTYLNNYLGANDNTEGMRILDSALLQRDPNASTAIKGAAQPFQNLGSYLTDTTAKGNQLVSNLKSQIDQSGQDVRNQTKSVTDQFNQDLTNRVTGAQNTASTNDAAFMNAVKGGLQISPEEAQKYGVTNWNDIINARNLLSQPDAFINQQEHYGRNIDLSPYVTPGNPQTAFNSANVANQGDYAREAALQQLTGGNFNILPDDVSQAGTAPDHLSQFNQNGATTDTVGLLGNLDQQFLQNEFNPGLGGGMSPSDLVAWLQAPGSNGLPKMTGYQQAVDIANRNQGQLTPEQKQLATYLQQELGLAQPGGKPADGTGTQDPSGGRLRVVNTPDGQTQQMWYDGGKWVAAPTEFRNMVNGGYTEKFNYQTGQYEPTGWTGTEGGRGPGVVGFGTGANGAY